ncbi:MAG: hypothetical protein P8Y71_16810 [Pseudolabrys sp.]
MRPPKVTFIRIVLASLVGVGALSLGGVPSIQSGTFVTKASARIGRPLTPLSYAGVARRTTRRTVRYGAAAGAAAAAGRRCVQVADAYGRIITRCY